MVAKRMVSLVPGKRIGEGRVAATMVCMVLVLVLGLGVSGSRVVLLDFSAQWRRGQRCFPGALFPCAAASHLPFRLDAVRRRRPLARTPCPSSPAALRQSYTRLPHPPSKALAPAALTA
ncbi:hypothetical protein BCV69DRAFT_183773 [Microstroma glucosiphilum]|uniref:Uncharacterized protein n=1 Tax=Pseudomicrostroma glucosiphilum TaxID=1684307 RepID=A0A316U739_9BASI|nr:hypothetical protein BCV69DRAFT_183773 [Pseudomicrostroma glucosiphilum]PWN21076.1 hypothetical protein BCV69DRAFT_183773 [Pseudomicrostroma glucosiphilum]